MPYKRILTIQDISCLGQCSLTVALPVISACGHETCILPSAVLSTHTGGFSGYTVKDLSEDIIDRICFCIEYHEEYNWNGKNVDDLNALILQDADNLKDCVPTCVYEQRNTIKNLIELSKLKG